MESGGDTALVAEHLTKVIGDRTIVDDVSFALRGGEVFGFLGPNGAGKTTTIRMLVGLIAPTRGSITICGHDVRRDFERALRCVGCIVENPDLYRFMTGRENLEHFARMLGVASGEIERVAALVNLAHRLDQRVGTYSLGMRQRLGIAQALLGDPRVLILDEPANGLDPAGIREIRELLRGLAAERGMAVFVSSHLLAEVELTCDRVAIIHKGRILKTGSVRELISSQRTMEFRVDDVARAHELFRARGVEAESYDDTLVAAIDETQAPPLIAALAEQGVGVFHAREKVHTLEELFLEATGGETVG
ncbi:MAG: ABC transporter ATP-binding protein [Acidobacteria bacterium]|nr:ABC transporter ATP-binding protein [Acidobacteriota bacterium]MBV9478844.1 ABC transporter ATP-binding protein [Acidobacteriota bacterium]